MPVTAVIAIISGCRLLTLIMTLILTLIAVMLVLVGLPTAPIRRGHGEEEYVRIGLTESVPAPVQLLFRLKLQSTCKAMLATTMGRTALGCGCGDGEVEVGGVEIRDQEPAGSKEEGRGKEKGERRKEA